MSPALIEALRQLAEAQRQVKNAELATQQMSSTTSSDQMRKLVGAEYAAEDRRDKAITAVLLAFGDAENQRADRPLLQSAVEHLEGYEKVLGARPGLHAPLLRPLIDRIRAELGRR